MFDTGLSFDSDGLDEALRRETYSVSQFERSPGGAAHDFLGEIFMDEKTVKKASGPRDTVSETGGISRGSDEGGHVTKAAQSTSTGSPQTPVSAEFLDKLGEMHDAEEQLATALFLLQKAAKSEDLKTLLDVHHKETKGHARSLEELAATIGKELPKKKCEPVRSMIHDAELALAKSLVTSTERDQVIFDAGKKAEKFEIDAYTPLCETAERNNWTHENAVLASILNQEKLASELLAGVEKGEEPLNQLIEKVSLKHAAGAAK